MRLPFTCSTQHYTTTHMHLLPHAINKLVPLLYPTLLIHPLTCSMPLERWRMMALRVLNHARRCGSLTPSSMGRSPAHNEQYIIHVHQMDDGWVQCGLMYSVHITVNDWPPLSTFISKNCFCMCQEHMTTVSLSKSVLPPIEAHSRNYWIVLKIEYWSCA